MELVERTRLGSNRQSPARRRSKRSYYNRNASWLRAGAAVYYKQNRAHVLAVQHRRRRRAVKARPFKWHKPTEAEWGDIKTFYQQRNLIEPISFKLLAVYFGISKYAVQRRSSADGGWALRRTS